jgi:hypothetical protein
LFGDDDPLPVNGLPFIVWNDANTRPMLPMFAT